MLATWGRLVYRRRLLVLALSIGLLALALLGLVKGTSPSYNPNTVTGTESGTATDRRTASAAPAAAAAGA